MVRTTATFLALLVASPALTQEAPDAVLSLGGSVTEIIYRLGAEERLVGRDTTSTYPPEVERLPDVGYLRALSAEGVLSVSPDLIIAEHDAGPPETVEMLEGARIPFVHVPQAMRPAEVLEKIEAVGAALDLSDRAVDLAEEVQGDLDRARTAALEVAEGDRLSVLFILSTQGGRIMAAGEGTAAAGIIELAGARNAMSGLNGYKQVTEEALTAAAPEVVLMMDRGGSHGMSDADLFALPALSATPAAESQRVLRMNGLKLLGFGPRTGEAALELHEALYGG